MKFEKEQRWEEKSTMHTNGVTAFFGTFFVILVFCSFLLEAAFTTSKETLCNLHVHTQILPTHWILKAKEPRKKKRKHRVFFSCAVYKFIWDDGASLAFSCFYLSLSLSVCAVVWIFLNIFLYGTTFSFSHRACVCLLNFCCWFSWYIVCEVGGWLAQESFSIYISIFSMPVANHANI